MQSINERIADLIIRSLDQGLNVQEQQELDAWIAQSAENRVLAGQFMEDESLKEQVGQLLSQHKVWERVSQVVFEQKKPMVRRLAWRRWLAAACIAGLMIAGGYWLWQKERMKTEGGLVKTTDIEAPKVIRATIKLANGQVVYLDSAREGALANEGQTKLVRKKDGQIAYVKEANNTAGALQYNTLSNPRGSQVVDVMLVDGTKIWLNAGSSITYPVAFSGTERVVSMTGEAYLEVAHNPAQPFYVESGSARVKVLGTHFNVNAYTNEKEIKVSLLEGAVQVDKAQYKVRIAPGQQAVIREDIQVNSDVDMEAVTAWKNGIFNFEGLHVPEAMRQLERWYDIDIIIKPDVPDYILRGKMTKGMTLSNLMTVLKELGLHYELDKQTLTILR